MGAILPAPAPAHPPYPLSAMRIHRYVAGTLVALAIWLSIAAGALVADRLLPGFVPLPSGRTLFELLVLLAGILCVTELLTLATHIVLGRQRKPPVEGAMIGRVYRLLGVLATGLGVAYGMGALATFGTFFSLFGGMLLGWSLQAPVSGFAAWILVSLKRPFRPGDRIQFPSLGLTGDVAETGPMYTYLNQVGGTIGSEEAVGRYILVPNAMLFSQVVINYTVVQESPYMLDEVIVRITYDSAWDRAEAIMKEAAIAVTGDIIQATGVEPYIRSDLYDYGVYLRLRYQTRVKDRAEISYRITRMIFESVQHEQAVDLAIPYVYSYRVGADRKDEAAPPPPRGGRRNTREVPLEDIISTLQPNDTQDIAQVARTMSAAWLRQPIVLTPAASPGHYQIVAGHLQYEVCRHLQWRTMPAVVIDADGTPLDAPEPSST